jgi:hypothetical protein
MKTYHGRIKTKDLLGPLLVYVSGSNSNYDLSPKPSQALINHSPDGFAWGYGGSGPAQLALAILLDYTGDRERSLALYQDFKWQYVAHWPQQGDWTLTAEEIDGFLQKSDRMEHLG